MYRFVRQDFAQSCHKGTHTCAHKHTRICTPVYAIQNSLLSVSQSFTTSLLLKILRPRGKAHPAQGKLPGQAPPPLPPPLPNPFSLFSFLVKQHNSGLWERAPDKRLRLTEINPNTTFQMFAPEYVLIYDSPPPPHHHTTSHPSVACFPFLKGIAVASGKTGFMQVCWYCYDYRARRWTCKGPLVE